MSMNEEIEGNTSLGFVYNRNQLSVHFLALIKTSCSGNIFDCHIVNDWLGSNVFECYEISPNSTSLAIEHAINI